MLAFAQKQNPPQSSVPSNPLRTNAPAFGPHRADSISHSWGANGDQAVRKEIQIPAEAGEGGSTGTASPRLGHSFNRISITHTPGPRLQRKCACGSPAMAGGQCEECSRTKR